LADLALLCRVHRVLCALPLAQVSETLRPLPIEPLAGAPGFVCGVSLLRGVPVPVVDLGLLLGTEQVRPTRFVALRAGARSVALAVGSVLGVRSLAGAGVRELPPLLQAAGSDAVQALGRLDRELLLVLESGRLVPDALFAQLDAEGRRP
jgi:purine-binding chemotaxis protein CheW